MINEETKLLNMDILEGVNMFIYASEKYSVIRDNKVLVILEDGDINIFIDKQSKYIGNKAFYTSIKRLVKKAYNDGCFKDMKELSKDMKDTYYYVAEIKEKGDVQTCK